ncbi:amidohydrolase family protein [Klebsiella aerogenes]|nr:amidohydrolase family protein [Klebsiella aerogenes]
MKLIGIEEHFLTEDVCEAWKASGLEAKDPSIAFNSGITKRRLFDLADERIALMDETGLDVQVLSLTSPALQGLGPESLDMAQRINDSIAEVVARYPDRFQALATLPVSMPDEAAIELERCIKTLGLKGTMLCSGGAEHLDSPAYFPVLSCAETLNVPVLIHPGTPDEAVRTAYYSGFSPEVNTAFATYGLGWHYDAGIQFIRLVLSGTFDRLPGLQMILGHWGELVLFYAERVAAMNRVANLKLPIASYLRENLYVTASGMFLPHFLDRAVAIVGSERILFSTDYPFQYRTGNDARQFLEKCNLNENEKAAFAHSNWMRLTRDRNAD